MLTAGRSGRPVPFQPGPDLLNVADRDGRWDPGGSALRALQPALTAAEARESGQAGGHFRCRLERRMAGWAVDTCV